MARVHHVVSSSLRKYSAEQNLPYFRAYTPHTRITRTRIYLAQNRVFCKIKAVCLSLTQSKLPTCWMHCRLTATSISALMASPVVTTTTVTQLQLMLRTTVTKFPARTLVCSPALSVVNSVNKIILTYGYQLIWYIILCKNDFV